MAAETMQAVDLWVAAVTTAAETQEAPAAAINPIILIPAAVYVRNQEMNADRRNPAGKIRAEKDSVLFLHRAVHADAKNNTELYKNRRTGFQCAGSYVTAEQNQT